MTATRSLVVGAGISGLAAGMRLADAGRNVTIVESRSRIGGVISTVDEAGYLFEIGPNSFPSNATGITEMITRVGIEDRVIEANPDAALRLLYIAGELVPLPMGPKEFLKTKLFTWPEKLRILFESYVPRRKSDAPESVAQFFMRRFGLAPTRTIVDAFVSGIYAGDARSLGVEAAFPALVQMEKEHGSILRAMKARRRRTGGIMPKITGFVGGMSDLIDGMAHAFSGTIQLNRRVTAVSPDAGGYRVTFESTDAEAAATNETFDEVIFATNPNAAAMLLSEVCPMASDLVCDVDMAPLVVLHAGFDLADLPEIPAAFGYLVPRPERMRTLGWLFNSSIFDGRAPEGKVAMTGYIGGARDTEILEASKAAIRDTMLGELSVALRMTRIPKPEYISIHEHVPGLPQQSPGHERRMTAIQQLVKSAPGIRLVGNYVEGISLNDCILTANKTMDGLLAETATPPEMEAAS